ncbi:MAG: transketolase [Bdellovibrionales bacterium]
MDRYAERRCNAYRKRILELSRNVTALHVAPAFSCVEIVDAVYNDWIFAAPDKRNIFIMSKGHGCLIQYMILHERGLLTDDDIKSYCKPGGRLGAHPDYGVPGIEASTGSLGHGLGIATGRALGKKLRGDNGTVFCVMSDGELQEGSSWEAAMMAANKNLDNLTVLVDNNDFSGLERMSESHPSFYPLADKFQAFGWSACQVEGHDSAAINEAIGQNSNRPKAIICKTIKGKGVSYMEHEPIWHYRSPNDEEYEIAMQELARLAS